MLGIDEAGRGPWAGPVAVAGVLLDSHWFDPRVMDSKQLSEQKRNELAPLIMQHAKAWTVRFGTVQAIDTSGIRNVVRCLMTEIAQELGTQAKRILVDYERIELPNKSVEAFVKGDRKSYAIACASVLAKTSRDAQMLRLDAKYPAYGFKQHKGYGTKQHQAALKQFGAIAGVHRHSYAPIAQLINVHKPKLFS